MFVFVGTKVYGHKVVLSARSKVMQAMFCGQFAEGTDINDVSTRNHNTIVFLSFWVQKDLYTLFLEPKVFNLFSVFQFKVLILQSGRFNDKNPFHS